MSDVVMRLNAPRRTPVVVPDGYRLRPYRPGDEETWARIQGAADETAVAPTLFAAEFDDRIEDLVERQLYAVDLNDNPVGTVTAWFADSPFEPPWGRLHWLAVVPRARRVGLGSALVASALNCLLDFGHTAVYLDTSSSRVEALRLYSRFGFVPDA